MTLQDTADKISSMEIRGAGKIARAAAEALRDHGTTVQTADVDAFRKEMKRAGDVLLATRPTAVSLPNAINFVLKSMGDTSTSEEALEALATAAEKFIEDSKDAVARIAAIGARHIRDGDTILTHCNSQVALACIIEAHRQGKQIEVFATEVRPRNQGLLTIKALNAAGITTNYIVDSAARSFMREIDCMIIGTDAVAVNGSVVNKIGTSQIALAAHEARVPLLVAAETYKFAPRTMTGALIPIEERNPSEVLDDAIAVTLPHVRVRNPAFDITPADYIDLILTEKGAIPPEMAYMIIREHLGWTIDDLREISEK